MDRKTNPKRVLHIVSAMDRGGAETLIMNIYRKMDRSKLQFDFITHSKQKGDFDDEILALGGKIYQIESLGETGPVKYIKKLVKIMRFQNYVAIHSHTDYQGGFPGLAAKIAGISTRICHSHSNNWLRKSSLKNTILLGILKMIIRLTATKFCSCSVEAAHFLFGKKLVEKGKVNILKNGIDEDPFLEKINYRDSVLNELNLPNEVKLIGHVGHFSQSKNQTFILNILRNIIKTDPNFVAVFVGDGPLKKEVERKAEELGLLGNVRFLGVRSDVPRLMKSFHVFVFPSLFEGFGIAALEAQCAGTPCVMADTVPKTTDLGLNLVSYLSLYEDIAVWSNTIIKANQIKRPSSDTIKEQIIKNGFSAKENVSQWLAMYLVHSKLHLTQSYDLLIRGR